MAEDTRRVVPCARPAHKRPAGLVDTRARRPHLPPAVADSQPPPAPPLPPHAPLVQVRTLPAAPDDGGLPGYTVIGPVPSERKARDWALVLQSMSIGHLIRRAYGGWVLLVPEADYPEARGSIDRYEAENRDWPPRPTRERLRHPSSLAIPLVFAALTAFFLVTGPAMRNSAWFTRGVAVSSLILSREPWRAVTALTLHADDLHILGNAVSGTIFASAVQRRLGAGGAALAVLGSGILGNLANAVYYHLIGAEHESLGASTAIFGAIGLLAATEVVLHQKRTWSWLDVASPIVGGFALLGALGSGDGDGRTDLGAHLFGFLAGVLIGLAVALPMRRATLALDVAASGPASLHHHVSLGSGTPRWWVQTVLGALAAAIVIVSWEMAFRR